MENIFFSSASLDFSGIDYSNVKYLYNKSFSYSSSLYYPETFKFTLINKDGNSSRVMGQNVVNGTHEYFIDIHGMTKGKDIAKALFSLVKNNPPNNKKIMKDTEAYVAATDLMIKKDDNTLIIRTVLASNSEEEAKNRFPQKGYDGYGVIECSNFTIDLDDMPIEFGCNTTSVQASGEKMIE